MKQIHLPIVGQDVPEPRVGMLVDYASDDGQTSPAVVSVLLGDRRVELAVPEYVRETGTIADVPFAKDLTCGHWSPQVELTKEQKKQFEFVANPYRIEHLRSGWYFSPSQIELWSTCKRKWGYRYITKIKTQNKYAKRGDETHGFAEAWLKYGIPPPAHVRTGKLVRAGIKYLPEPTTAKVEGKGQFISRAGFRYSLGIDCSYVKENYQGREIVVVLDHKSTTDFKWSLLGDTTYSTYRNKPRITDNLNPSPELQIKNAERKLLRNDGQSLLYSAWSFSYWGVEETLLEWVYYKDDEKRPAATLEQAYITRDEVEEKFTRLDAVAEEMFLYGLTATKPEDLPANPEACMQKGGCTYIDDCPITDAERLAGYMSQSSLRSKLTGGASNGAGAAPQAAPVQPQTTVPAGTSRLEALRAATPASAAPAARQVAPAPAARQVAPAAPTAPARTPAPNPNPPASARVPSSRGLAAMRAGQPVPGGAPVETAPPAAAAGAQEIPDDQLPPGEESIADFDPAQINPPEQPENLIQDTDELNAANEANAPAGSRKGAGRPKGSVTVKPQTDEGYIFAEVFKVVIGVLMANPLVEDPIETAGEIARGAIAEFRKPIA